jgi:ectoine hydroxylase-related dioxygenase (phytanoyl-CoA dioxygenase family)
MIPDLDIMNVSPGQFREHMLARGTVILRRAVPSAVVEPLGHAVQCMMDHYDAIPADVIRREMEHEEPGRKNMWQEVLKSGVHYNADLIAFSQGRHSLFDPFRKSRLAELVSQAWPEKEVRENFITNVRRVFGAERLGYADTPLATHIDAMVHQHETLGINFWTPLTNAGIEEPGLAVIPMSVHDTRVYLEYDPKGYALRPDDIGNLRYFRYEKLDPAALESAGMTGRFERPMLRPGDVLAFTNYTIHATSVEPRMTKHRVSIEVRILLFDRPGTADLETKRGTAGASDDQSGGRMQSELPSQGQPAAGV